MRTRVALALSVTGVLVAGSAAAMVNAQILSSSTGRDRGAGVAVELPVDVPVGVPTTTPADGGLPSGTVEAVVSTTTTVVAPTTAATYRIGAAGSVTLDAADDLLRAVAVERAPGWTVVAVTQISPVAVQVTFRSADADVVFGANAVYGVVSTSIDTLAAAPAPTAPGATAGPVVSTPTTGGTLPDGDGDDSDSDDDDHDDGSDSSGSGSGDDRDRDDHEDD